ncbi:hypothetical protein BDQ17DRAFT_1432626 [Cyathus striatus]|nr:hypothetical protein BDQ17DRAFT_1432626 [Cyathus striatus]
MPVSDAVVMQIPTQLEAIQVSQQVMQAKLDELALTKTGDMPLELCPIPQYTLYELVDSVGPPISVPPTSLSPAPSMLVTQPDGT